MQLARGAVGRSVQAILRPAGYRLVPLTAVQRLALARQQRLELIRELQGCLFEHVLAPLPPSEQREDLLAGLMGTGVSEALFVLSHLHRSLNADGDVAEVGVAQGATSALLAGEIRGIDKRLWLYDSFEGLPQPTERDVLIDDIFQLGTMEAYAGTMAVSAHEVQRRLRTIGFPEDRVRIVPGFIEETFTEATLPERFCFVYIDLDLYAPIRFALEQLGPRLAQGGSIVVDDYGHFSAGAQAAVDEFAAANEDVFSLSLPPPWAGRFAVLERRGPRPDGRERDTRPRRGPT